MPRTRAELKARRVHVADMSAAEAFRYFSDYARELRGDLATNLRTEDWWHTASLELERINEYRERYVRNRLGTRALNRAIDRTAA